MEAFFATNRFHRRPGMRMAEYNLLWHKRVEELSEVGVDILALDDVAGWFYFRGARFSEEQRDLSSQDRPFGTLRAFGTCGQLDNIRR